MTDFGQAYWQDYPSGYWVRYAQYWTTNQYTDADRYQFPDARPGANNSNWEDFYLVLNDLREIKQINRQQPEQTGGSGSNANQIAIAQIMQAYVWQVMTDQWGPIPYEGALQGRGEGNFNPSYNSQETIYYALLDSLANASENIDPSGSALGSGDIIYGGDMAKWKKFANALRMRIAMRMADQDAERAQTAINDAISEGAFTSNEDNALLAFSSSQPYLNPYYDNYEVSGRDDWAIPESILGYMNDRDDPRRSAYFTSVDDGEFRGFPYGLEQGEAQQLFREEPFSRPGQRVRQATSPAILMLYDEVLFIKAEAALRSDLDVSSTVSASGEQLYRDAIRASMNYWGVSDESAINDYLSQISMPTDGEDPVLGEQKWLALYMQGIQGWAEIRRLDLVDDVIQLPPDNPGQALFGEDYPLRMAYPQDEGTLNEANMNDAIEQYLGGTDNQGVRLWWDVN
jgi:hypothetical protein